MTMTVRALTLGTLALALSSASCGPSGASPEPAAPTETQSTKVVFANQRELARDMTAVNIPNNSNRDAVEEAARELCDGKDFCKVLGWPEGTSVPRGFPMTDREVSGQVFSYSLNRQTGMDEAVWTSGTR